MKVRYINLDSAPDRRSRIEANFRMLAPSAWSMERVSAVSSTDPQIAQQSGNIRPSEKACFLSHRKALAAALEETGASMIVEDDAQFGSSTFDNIERLASVDDGQVDIVFTNVLIQEPANLVPQFLMRRQLAQQRQVTLIDLTPYAFVGADAYIVTSRGKKTLASLLQACTRLDAPYDIQLQTWVRERKLQAVVTFPYLTTLSPDADVSMNGNGNLVSLALNGLRRMLAFDPVPGTQDATAQLMREAAQMSAPAFDRETDEFAELLRVLLARSVLKT